MRQGAVRSFGKLPDGRTVSEYTLTNDRSLEVRVLDYGGIVRCLAVPDRNGTRADVVLGFDSLEQYERNEAYLGAIIGRVAGRIRNGKLRIGADDCQLTVNEPPNHLHGGTQGFSHALWSVEAGTTARRLVLKYTSAAGEDGYPGRLTATVTYELTDEPATNCLSASMASTARLESEDRR